MSAGVEYPALYAPEDHKHAREFNSAQRAHQNTLEGMPYFIAQLLVVGAWPVAARRSLADGSRRRRGRDV